MSKCKCRKCGREASLWSVWTEENMKAGELFGSALCFPCLPPQERQRIEKDQANPNRGPRL